MRNADAISVLEDGRIIERGDHQALLEQKGRYYQLYTGMFELSGAEHSSAIQNTAFNCKKRARKEDEKPFFCALILYSPCGELCFG